jgi:hypothetical protein
METLAVTRRISRATLVLLVVLAVGCTDEPTAETSAGKTPQAERTRWEKAHIRDYRWSIYVGCFCDSGTATIKVANGKPVEARQEAGPFAIEKDERFGLIPLTIEDLFDRLDDAYASGADVVDVTYDSAYGFPSELRVDPSRMTADDEMEYSVRSFEPTTT